MKYLVVIPMLILVLSSSCTSDRRKLIYGKDVCEVCKMTLADKKFGAELITKDEQIYKFDDLNCLLAFFDSNAMMRMDYSYQLVVNYARPGELIDSKEAFYFKSSEAKSPMKGNIAAFNSQKELNDFRNNKQGKILTWADVVAELK